MFLFNFIILHYYNKILSKYQMIEECIIDMINVFQNDDYTNSIAVT